MKTFLILGAGASYGACRQENIERLPLTAELFSGNDIRQGTTEGLTIISLVNQARQRTGSGFDFEKALANLSENPTPKRVRQLCDIRFSIHNVIATRVLSHFQSHPTLYEDLWFRMRSGGSSDGAVSVMNMNYDTMIDAVVGKAESPICTIEDHIRSDDWCVVHPHGSISWAYDLKYQIADNRSISQLLTALNEVNLEEAPLVHLGSDFPFTNQLATAGNAKIPALALPVAGKIEKEHFVCPNEHLKRLRSSMSEADGVVSIGWRAADKHIVRLLSGARDTELNFIHVVSASEEESMEIGNRLTTDGLRTKSLRSFGNGMLGYLESPEFDSLYPNPAVVAP